MSSLSSGPRLAFVFSETQTGASIRSQVSDSTEVTGCDGKVISAHLDRGEKRIVSFGRLALRQSNLCSAHSNWNPRATLHIAK